MNQTFSLSRFGRLLRTYFVENRNALLASVAVLFVVLVAFSLVVYNQMPSVVSNGRYALLFLVGGAAWYVFTVQQVAVLNEKERAITYLLRPASQVEKWAQLVLLSGLGFLTIYLVLFSVVDSIGIWLINHHTWKPEELKMIRENYDNQLTVESYLSWKLLSELPINFWLSAAFIHPASLALALLVRRYTLPLLPVIAFVFLFALIIVNVQLIQSFVGNQVSASVDSSGNAFIEKGHDWRMLRVPQPAGDLIRYGVGVSVVLLLYVTAFFRLKEREV